MGKQWPVAKVIGPRCITIKFVWTGCVRMLHNSVVALSRNTCYTRLLHFQYKWVWVTNICGVMVAAVMELAITVIILVIISAYLAVFFAQTSGSNKACSLIKQ